MHSYVADDPNSVPVSVTRPLSGLSKPPQFTAGERRSNGQLYEMNVCMMLS